MKYQQKRYPFYNPNLVRMSMGTLDFVVNYADMLDQTCVEFRHVHECYEIYYCLSGMQPVSYTHLDVYKRQINKRAPSMRAVILTPNRISYSIFNTALMHLPEPDSSNASLICSNG